MSVWSRVRGLLRSNDELVAEDLHKAASDAGADAIGEAEDRAFVHLQGTVEVLTVLPRGTTPWLEAELSDGTGRVTLIWMGRRDIPGLIAGRRLAVEGRISVEDGRRRIFNPRYELL